MKNLVIRTASGAVMLVVLLGAILASKWSFIALMAVIAVGGMWEFYRFCEKAGYNPQKWLGIFLGIVILAIGFASSTFFDTEVDGTGAMILMATLPLMLLTIPLMAICELYRKSDSPIANIATSIFGSLYVALPIALMLVIPLLMGGGEWNPWIVLFYVFIIWANDVFAYLFGITLGKHRLFERISPKKSWEGFVGGLIGAMGMGYLAAVMTGGDLVEWIGMALIAAITGVFGDLVESLFKRSVDVKDSGQVIPGHGGWLDRFDALLLSVPFAFIYLVICAVR